MHGGTRTLRYFQYFIFKYDALHIADVSQKLSIVQFLMLQIPLFLSLYPNTSSKINKVWKNEIDIHSEHYL